MARNVDDRPGRRPAVRMVYDLAAVVERRDGLVRAWEFELVGKALDRDRFDRLVALAREALPAAADPEAVRDSLRPLAGRTLAAADAADFAHRLAGNVKRLSVARPVMPWTVQDVPEWVPFQILAARRRRTSRGRLGWSFVCKAMAGTPCPLRAVRFWTDAQCAFLARQFGFRRPPSRKSRAPVPYLYHTGRQLVTLRFLGLVDPALSAAGPTFSEVQVPSGLRAWNDKVFRLRDRAEPDCQCPQGFPRSFACQDCPFGYLSCPAGTHREDYAIRYCPVCKGDDACFDVELGTDRCVACHDRAVVRGDL